ncbi:NADH-quinone oxidoreductase subunit M [Pontibacter sp. G13]|uniref:complex I subunit 4 family protein n=1 Tax=Pontibacter sp. G13 TaxID=3074898 RepID=UPI00288919BC|nr:NADH-quinone oxidoreductase subunit M [Pontibacter sp. G13]WNJ16453.1 NADH-quinone oxidoreductase subunit M [Pontibacter sp. G13]
MSNDLMPILLNATLFAPLVGIIFILLMKKNVAKVTALGFSLIPLFLSALAIYFYAGNPQSGAYGSDFVLFSSSPWFNLNTLDIKYMIGIDGVSTFMILLTSLIFPILVWYSWGKVEKQEKTYYLMLLLLETGILGFFLSLDLMMFYVFFEMVLIPTTFFIGIWGGKEREFASMKFFLYTLVGSLLMLVGIIYLGLNVKEGVLTTDYFAIRDALASGAISSEVQTWLFLAFTVSFAIKVPLFPLHTWQAVTYSESSTTGSVILAALLSKMGAFGFIRFVLPFFPEASMKFAPVISVLAVISIVYGAYMAIAQTDLKRLIAFASMSHLGFIVLGIFSMTPEALSGAVYQMVAHGVSTAALFLIAGLLFERYESRKIADFQGIAKQAPKFTLVFMVAVLATVGLPGLSGFIGELMILLGSFSSSAVSSTFAVIAAISVVLTAVYLLNMFRKTMFGETNENVTKHVFDLTASESWMMAPLVILMFVMGFFAQPFLNTINKGTDRVINLVDTRTQNVQLSNVEPVKLETPSETEAVYQ